MPRPPRTLADCLVRAAAWPQDGLRVLDRRGGEEWLPWPALLQRARRVAGGLQALGVRPGDRVALVYPTCAAFFDACFGVLLAGGVPVPLYPPVRLGRLDEYHAATARMLAAAETRLVLADRWVGPLLGEAVRLARPGLQSLRLDDLPVAPATDVPTGETALGLVQFSSGTTREPKAVALTHGALVGQASMLNGFWPESDPVHHEGLSWLPLYHDMGLIGCVFTALVRPGTLTVLPPELFIAKPASWLRAISRYRATISPAPNFAYSFCVSRVRDEEMEGVDLSSWRIALNGAEHAVPEVMRAFTRRFARWGLSPCALTPVYGLSEAALAVTFSAVHAPFESRRFDRDALNGAGLARETAEGREIASVGQPVPGVDVRVVGPTGLALPEGRVGTIQCRSAYMMAGYLGQEDATRQVLRDGWLDTGDLGFTWKGGLYLSGRAKDMLLLRGRNYPPEEVERAVEQVPGIRSGCVVAVSWLPEGADGERLLVLAEARRSLARSAYEVTGAACAEAVLAAVGLRPDRVVVVRPGTLPRTSSGKLRRQQALQRFLAPAPSVPTATRLLRLLRSISSGIVFRNSPRKLRF